MRSGGVDEHSVLLEVGTRRQVYVTSFWLQGREGQSQVAHDHLTILDNAISKSVD